MFRSIAQVCTVNSKNFDHSYSQFMVSMNFLAAHTCRTTETFVAICAGTREKRRTEGRERWKEDQHVSRSWRADRATASWR